MVRYVLPMDEATLHCMGNLPSLLFWSTPQEPEEVREVLYVVTSLILPAVMAAVPLITRSYGYSPVDGCYLPAYANNITIKTAIIERFVLWDGPAMVILLVLSIAMAVMVITLAHKVCWRLKHEPIHCAKTLLYDSVFYSVYLNIHLKYTHQRIEPYTQVRIFKYNRSRDICGCLANR